jgi:hypothetical protein
MDRISRENKYYKFSSKINLKVILRQKTILNLYLNLKQKKQKLKESFRSNSIKLNFRPIQNINGRIITKSFGATPTPSEESNGSKLKSTCISNFSLVLLILNSSLFASLFY